MLAILIVIAIGAVVGGALALVFGNTRRFDEVDRFHRASRMTTEWARAGVTRPYIVGQDKPVDERDRADAVRE